MADFIVDGKPSTPEEEGVADLLHIYMCRGDHARFACDYLDGDWHDRVTAPEARTVYLQTARKLIAFMGDSPQKAEVVIKIIFLRQPD